MSSSIHSNSSQYDLYKVSLNKHDHFLIYGPAKVFFARNASSAASYLLNLVSTFTGLFEAWKLISWCGCCQFSILVSFRHHVVRWGYWSGRHHGWGAGTIKRGEKGGTTSIFKSQVGISIYLVHIFRGPLFKREPTPCLLPSC